MQRIAPLFIDHFGWGTMDESKTIDFFEKLGFHMGDKRTEEDIFWMSHFYMDEESSYINIYQLQKDGSMWPVKLDLDYYLNMELEERLSNPRGVTGVYTFVLSTRDCDASREAAIKAGFNVGPVYRRDGDTDSYYSRIGGSTTDDMFNFGSGTEPFPNMLFGVMEHNNEYHAHHFRKKIHEYHPNGVNKISSLVLFYETEEKLMTSLKLLHKYHDVLCDFSDAGYYTDTVRLIDKVAYEREFGVPAPNIRSVVVAVEFKNGDLDYIREQAKENGFSFFEKNGKLYVDGRDALNSFLIFS